MPRGTQATGTPSSPFVYRAFTVSGKPFQCSSTTGLTAVGPPAERPPSAYYPHLATPAGYSATWVWAPPLSLATTRGILSLPAGTKMFQFPACPPTGLCVHPVVREVRSRGFPHSDIPGLAPAHGSPRLFAVYHVLLRLLLPRHPPYALISFFHVIRSL